MLKICSRIDCRPKRLFHLLRCVLVVLSASILIACFPYPYVHAAQVQLAWDPSAGPDLKGYKVYYGTATHSYSYTVDVGLSTGCLISNLQEGMTYYFATKAYNTSGLESVFSNEVSWYADYGAPPAEYSVYSDALAAGWNNYSWGTYINFSSTWPDIGGKCIAVAYLESSAALSLSKSTAISTSGYHFIKFRVHGGSSSKACTFMVRTADNSGASVQVPFTAPAGYWSEITIPLSSLGNPSIIKRMDFMNDSGSATTTVYFDDIRLVT